MVQLTGALSFQAGDVSSIDLVRDVARASGGPAYVFYAPFTVRDAATARALREQPEVARAFSQALRPERAVLRRGLIGGVVTHTEIANALLDASSRLAERAPGGRGIRPLGGTALSMRIVPTSGVRLARARPRILMACLARGALAFQPP